MSQGQALRQVACSRSGLAVSEWPGLCAAVGMAISGDCSLLVTVSRDQSVKVFDVAGFDMVLMLKLNFVPATAEWIYRVRSILCRRSPSPKAILRL